MYLVYRLMDELESKINTLTLENDNLVKDVIDLTIENIKLKKKLHDHIYKANSNNSSSSSSKITNE